MNRRGFFSSLSCLLTTVALPTIPSISIASHKKVVLKLAMNSMYGKIGPNPGVVKIDYVSAYPRELLRGAGSHTAIQWRLKG